MVNLQDSTKTSKIPSLDRAMSGLINEIVNEEVVMRKEVQHD